MLEIEEVAKAIQEELIPKLEHMPSPAELEQFMLGKWGISEEVYSILQVVVKSAAEYRIKSFDDLPSDIRKRIAESSYDLDQMSLLDYYSQFGERATLAKIVSMETLAKKVLEDDYWRSVGLTPFAKFKKRAVTYAEAIAARAAAGREAVRRQNAARARKDAQG